MKKLAAQRRSPLALMILLLLGLTMTGTAYAALQPQADPGTSAATSSVGELAAGEALFQANCASCHGSNAQGGVATDTIDSPGPSLIGVGAASVDFQVATGRMPLNAPGVQAPENRMNEKFSAEEITQLAAYVDSLGAGPAVPEAQWLDLEGADIANGGRIFRTNCAMCHNSSAAGGALTRGKYAPSLMNVEPQHIYEAMQTGPQSMPVFNDKNITPQEKEDVIAFVKDIEEGGNSYGGNSMGSMGPAGDAVFIWTFGIGLLIAAAVWLGRKAA